MFTRRSFVAASSAAFAQLAGSGRVEAEEPAPQEPGTSIINVKSHGALGDGVHDDTAAIQSALDAVFSAAPGSDSQYTNLGGTVLMPAGTYYVTRTLTLKRGTNLVGMGHQSTMLLYGSPTGDVLYYQRPDSPPATALNPNISLRGFRILIKNGVRHTSGAGVHVDSADPHPAYSSRIDFDDLFVWFAHEGFRVRNIEGGSIRHCHASACGSSGFVFRGSVTMLHVSDCYSSSNGEHGFDISSFAYSSAIACGADANAGSGWHVKRQPGDSTVQNAFFVIGSEANVQSLFTFDGVSGATVQCHGNAGTIHDTTIDGVVINDCSAMTITPWIRTLEAASGYPFKVTGATTNVTVLGGSVGFFAGGTHQFSGIERVTFINFQGAGRVSLGGSTSGTQHPMFPLGVVDRTGLAGAANRIVADFRSLATDGKGSASARVSSDGVTAAEFEHNSADGGPFLYGSNGDAVVRSTGGRAVHLVAGNVVAASACADGSLEMSVAAEAVAVPPDRARLFVRNNGTGKTQLCVRFHTGAEQVIATEP